MIYWILLLSLFLRLPALNQSFWMDEAAQAVLSTKPIFAINYAADFQPPLFYILTHFWLSLGIRAEWFLRLLPVFFGILTIIVLYIFLKKLFDKKIALLASAFLATAPYHIYYSQEFRMYSFLTFLVLLSWVFLWEKRWVLYGLTILAAVFTHYFAFFAILSQFFYIFLFDRKSVKRYILHVACFLIPFLLWLPTLLKQIETAKLLTTLWPGWGKILGVSFVKFPLMVMAKFTVGMTSPDKILYIPAVIIVGMIFIFALTKAREKLLLIYLFIPLILAWIAGPYIGASTPHRLLFILPSYYSILAVGLLRLNRQWATITIATVLTFNLFFSFGYLLNSRNHRENWREAVAFTDKVVGSRGVVLTEADIPFVPIDWYSKNRDKYHGASTAFEITNKSVEDRLAPIIHNTNPIILYSYLFEISDPARLVEKNLKLRGFKIVEEKDFRGVGIIKIFSGFSAP